MKLADYVKKVICSPIEIMHINKEEIESGILDERIFADLLCC